MNDGKYHLLKETIYGYRKGYLTNTVARFDQQTTLSKFFKTSITVDG